MNDYIAAILFFLPAGIANVTPVAVKGLPVLKKWTTPVDFGRSLQGHRIFGDHKTWRGLIFGTLMGGVAAIIISKLNVNTVSTVDPFWVGCLLGFGALTGDAIKSFFKRRRNIKPGKTWFPFDQTDYIIGALLLVVVFVPLPLWAVGTIFAVYFLLHLLVNYTAYRLGINEQPI